MEPIPKSENRYLEILRKSTAREKLAKSIEKKVNAEAVYSGYNLFFSKHKDVCKLSEKIRNKLLFLLNHDESGKLQIDDFKLMWKRTDELKEIKSQCIALSKKIPVAFRFSGPPLVEAKKRLSVLNDIYQIELNRINAEHVGNLKNIAEVTIKRRELLQKWYEDEIKLLNSGVTPKEFIKPAMVIAKKYREIWKGMELFKMPTSKDQKERSDFYDVLRVKELNNITSDVRKGIDICYERGLRNIKEFKERAMLITQESAFMSEKKSLDNVKAKTSSLLNHIIIDIEFFREEANREVQILHNLVPVLDEAIKKKGSKNLSTVAMSLLTAEDESEKKAKSLFRRAA